jgi:TolB-like protein
LAVALVIAAAGPALAADGAPRRKIKVAVMEIRPLGADTHMADLLSEVALTEVGAMDRIEAIGRSDIESILGFEKQKKMFGCTEEASCLAEIGGALGVEFVIVGSLGRIGALNRLDVKLVETSKGRVRARTGESVEGREEKLVSAVQRAVHRLLDPLVAPAGAALPPPVVAAPALSEPKPEPEKKKEEEAPKAAGFSRKTWGYTVGAVGLAAIAGGAVSGLSAKAAYDDEKAAAAAGDLSTYESSRDTAKSRALIADVLYGVGAVGVGVGVYMVLTAPSASAPPVAINFTPTRSGGLLVLSGGF